VATPQRLWLGTARLDWQLGPKNTFLTSYSAKVNHLENVGVGGTSLAATGYDSEKYEHMLRFEPLWNCPVCGGSMRLVEWLSCVKIYLSLSSSGSNVMFLQEDFMSPSMTSPTLTMR
jgi:hypothetical protein